MDASIHRGDERVVYSHSQRGFIRKPQQYRGQFSEEAVTA